MNHYARWLLASLFAIACIFAAIPEAKASLCAENGGLKVGCLQPSGFVWRTSYGKELSDLNSALQSAAAELAENEPCQDCYESGLQSSPVDFLVYVGGCTNTEIRTDTTFTDISNPTWPVWPNSGPWGKRYSVHIYGQTQVPQCGGHQAHQSTSGAYVYHYPVCPVGYKAFRDEDNVQIEPYGFVCVPTDDPTLHDVATSEDTDCHDTSTAGGGSTQFPLDLGKRCKNETVDDIRVVGPWPLSWQRHINQNRFEGATSNTWMMDETRRLTVTPLRTSIPNIGFHMVYIDRRKGTFLTFKAAPVSGGARTWVNAMAQPGKHESRLEEVWDGETLVGWTLHQANGEKEIYSPAGEMVRRTSADGHNHHYTYAGNNIASIRDDFNHTLTFGYSSDQGFSESANYTWIGTGQTGTLFYSTSRAALLEARSIKNVTDGRRTVGYHWTAIWANSTQSSKRLLSDVIHSDGTMTQYNYGETVEGATSIPTFLSGVISEDNERFLTYKAAGANKSVGAEWRGGDTTGTGALGRLNLTSNKIVDQDGNEFVFSRKAGDAGNNKIAGYTTPCPDCNGLQAKNIYYPNTSDEISETRDWRNTRTTYTYDTAGRMTQRIEAFTNPLARTTNWTYPTDPALREPLTVSEPVMDATGTLRTRTTTYTYADLAATYPASSPCTGAHGGTAVPCASTRRKLTGITVSVNDGSTDRTWAFTYNSYGLRETMTAPNGMVTQWTWTADGQVASVTTGFGTSLAQTHTFGGHTTEGPTWTQGPSGLVTRWTRNLRGRIVREDIGIPGSGGVGNPDPDGTWPSSLGGTWRTATMTWRATNLLDTVTLPNGTSIQMGYDRAHRLTSMTGKGASSNLLWTRTLNLSPAGALLSDVTTNASSTVELSTTQTHNAIRDVATIVDSASNATTLGYDANFVPTSTTSPLGNTNTETLDVLGRPTTFTDAMNEISTLSYGPQDEVLAATDARSVQTNYAYNGFGDLVRITSPDRGQWLFGYNAAGQQITMTDPRGVVATTLYDVLGRTSSRTYSDAGVTGSPAGFVPGNHTQLFGYDSCTNGTSRLCGFQDASGSTSYTYNAWGQITGKAWVGAPGSAAAGVTLSTGYSFDAAGQLQAITYPSGKTLTIGRGSDGRISSLTYDGQNILTGATHTSYGAIQGWTWAATGLSSGQRPVSYSYTQDGAPQAIVDIDTREYVLDADKRITAIDDALDVTKSQLYGYDNVNRLTSADIGAWGGPVSYAYDGVGNRIQTTDSVSGLGKAFTYGLTNNKLVSTAPTTAGVPGATTTQTYDAMGSLINDGLGMTLGYDVTGRLVETTRTPSSTTQAYNVLGQRVRKTTTGAGSGTVLYAYDETGQLMGAYRVDPMAAGGFTVEEELVWLGEDWRPVATVRPDAALGMSAPIIYPILTDHLGTPRKVLDPATGFTRWDWDAKEPFGMQAPNDNPSAAGAFKFDGRFPGQRFDAETGLYHNGFRDYHAALGRYVQSDPLGLEAGWNTYAYVESSPIVDMDPTGLQRAPSRTTRNHIGAGGNSSQRRQTIRKNTRDALARSGSTPFPNSPPGSNLSSLDNQASLLEYLTDGEYEESCILARCPKSPMSCGPNDIKEAKDWIPYPPSPQDMDLFGCQCLQSKTRKVSPTSPQQASLTDIVKMIIKIKLPR